MSPGAIASLLVLGGLLVVVGARSFLRDMLFPAPSLEGGTRLVYSLDGPDETIDRAIAVVEARVKGRGFRGVHVAKLGRTGIVVEVPPEQGPTPRSLPLDGDLGADWTSFRVVEPNPDDLDCLWGLREFPPGGGTVQVGDERMTYLSRTGVEFIGLSRGRAGSRASEHVSGERVVHDSVDGVRQLVETQGVLELLVVADRQSDFPAGTDEVKERARLRDWLLAHPLGRMPEFNYLGPDSDGPTPGIRWVPRRLDGSALAPQRSRADTAVPVVRQGSSTRIGKRNIANVRPGTGTYGDATLVVELRGSDLREWMRANTTDGRTLAVALDDQVVEVVKFSEATLNSLDLGGHVAPDGLGFDEIQGLYSILRNDDLPALPKLERIELIDGEMGK